MAEPRYIQAYGNQMMIGMDDGSKRLALPTNTDVWVISGTGGGVDPGDGDFIFPFDNSLILPGNGFRTPERPGHDGVDYTGGAASDGNPVVCAGAGTVYSHDPSHSGWGNHIVVEHTVPGIGAVFTRYAHMQNGSVVVSVGSPIAKGATIGLVGNTGASFGAHLHFETCEGTPFNWLDPILTIPAWNAA